MPPMPRKPYRAPAHWYDAENARHDVLKQDVPFFLGQLPAKKQSILELACGTGRAAIPLALAGHRVVGIDYAPEMIDLAIQKRASAGIAEKRLKLAVADMLDLKLGEKFDWVCVFFNTLCNFTSLELLDQVMAGVVRHMKPNGRFWTDLFNPDPGLWAEPVATQRDPYIFRSPTDDRTIFFHTDVYRSSEPQVQHVVHRYEWFDDKGKRRKASHEFDMTSIYPREFRLLVERHGLEVEQMWGNYDGSPVTPDAPRIIARCCRG